MSQLPSGFGLPHGWVMALIILTVASMPSSSSPTELEQFPISIGGLAFGLVVSAIVLKAIKLKKRTLITLLDLIKFLTTPIIKLP